MQICFDFVSTMRLLNNENLNKLLTIHRRGTIGRVEGNGSRSEPDMDSRAIMNHGKTPTRHTTNSALRLMKSVSRLSIFGIQATINPRDLLVFKLNQRLCALLGGRTDC